MTYKEMAIEHIQKITFTPLGMERIKNPENLKITPVEALDAFEYCKERMPLYYKHWGKNLNDGPNADKFEKDIKETIYFYARQYLTKRNPECFEMVILPKKGEKNA